MRTRGLFAAIALLLPMLANAQVVLFTEDFESGLDQWTGKYLGPHSGVTVPDPFDPTNHVVTFLQATSWGDIFSDETPVQEGQTLVVRFDYLGLEVDGSQPGNYGGFLGYTDDTIPGVGHGQWLAGTDGTSGAAPILIDDGSWHSYSVEFDPYETGTPAGDVIRIHMEDFRAPAGDVFFDDIRLEVLATVATERSTWGRVKARHRR